MADDSGHADVGFHRHGKIPTLKISLIQIFCAHLWAVSYLLLVFDCRVSYPVLVHKSVVMDLVSGELWLSSREFMNCVTLVSSLRPGA